jgi:hypothetical protein
MLMMKHTQLAFLTDVNGKQVLGRLIWYTEALELGYTGSTQGGDLASALGSTLESSRQKGMHARESIGTMGIETSISSHSVWRRVRIPPP